MGLKITFYFTILLIILLVLFYYTDAKIYFNSSIKIKPKGFIEGDFDGIPLPESTSSVLNTTMSNAFSGQQFMYKIPLKEIQSIKNAKYKKPVNVDDSYVGQYLGASIVSIGTIISLTTFVLIVMAGKALLIATGAITLTFLSSSWLKKCMNLATFSTILKIISQPYHSRGHRILSEAQLESYTPVQQYYSGGY